jgi:aspartate aminotransferase-like enzyme
MTKFRLMTPGPSPVPEDTLLEMAKPVHYHRTPEAKQYLHEVMLGVQYVLQTKNDVVTLTSSGTGAMEAALVNSVPKGGKAICVFCGRFGERWHKLWQTFGVNSIAVTAPWGQTVPAEQVAKALAEHPDAQAVCAVHSETSTGVKSDIKAYGQLVAKTNAAFIVDAISSAGALELRTDEWLIDFLATGSQKALMLPPGLAFLSVSEKGWKKVEANTQPATFYFDLKKARSKLKDPDTSFTPAHTLIRALRLSLQRIKIEGIENVWNRHARMAHAAQSGVKAIGLELYSHPPAEGLTAFNVPSGIDGKALLSKAEKQYGLKIAGGQDQLQGKIVRLAHMGYMDFFDVLAGLSGLELVLAEMGYRFESGAAVAAAQKAYAEWKPGK